MALHQERWENDEEALVCCQCLVHANRFDLVVHAVCAVCLIFARYVMSKVQQLHWEVHGTPKWGCNGAEKRNDTMERKAVLRSASCMCVRLCCHVACSIFEIHVNFFASKEENRCATQIPQHEQALCWTLLSLSFQLTLLKRQWLQCSCLVIHVQNTLVVKSWNLRNPIHWKED